ARVVVGTRGDVGTDRGEVVRPGPEDTTCSASLRAGVAAAEGCDGVMLLLGDTPGTDASVIDAVRAAWEATRPWALAAQYEDGLGHPLVFAAEALLTLRLPHCDQRLSQ